MMSPARSERAPLRPLLTHSELTHLEGPLHPAFPTACAALLPSLTLRARWIPAGGRGTLRVARTLMGPAVPRHGPQSCSVSSDWTSWSPRAALGVCASSPRSPAGGSRSGSWRIQATIPPARIARKRLGAQNTNAGAYGKSWPHPPSTRSRSRQTPRPPSRRHKHPDSDTRSTRSPKSRYHSFPGSRGSRQCSSVSTNAAWAWIIEVSAYQHMPESSNRRTEARQGVVTT